MSIVPPLARALLEALDEPALLVAGARTLAANRAALQLLGSGLVGQDVRFAIRQPQALDAILSRRGGVVEVVGIGGVERSWRVLLSSLDSETMLVRLIDRSAQRATEKAQVDFVANASHELRTPLATIIGFGETLAEQGDLPENLRRRFAGQIHGEATRMLGIVRDLMSLSRIAADRFKEPQGPVDLAAIAAEAVHHAKALADACGCGISLGASPGLPPLIGDPGQLRQLLDNLLGNAVRYGCSHPGSSVEVTLSAEGAWQSLTVRDHGDGIPARDLPRLTERFYRVDRARSRDSGGTGLGLAIVKEIVERHRGLLEIRSEAGKGTEVEVRLPTGARPLS